MNSPTNFGILEHVLAEGELIPRGLFQDGTSFFPLGCSTEEEIKFELLFSTTTAEPSSPPSFKPEVNRDALDLGALQLPPQILANVASVTSSSQTLFKQQERKRNLKSNQPIGFQVRVIIRKLIQKPVTENGVLAALRLLLRVTPTVIKRNSKLELSEFDWMWNEVCIAYMWVFPQRRDPQLLFRNKMHSIVAFLASRLSAWSLELGDKKSPCKRQSPQSNGSPIGEIELCKCLCASCCSLAQEDLQKSIPPGQTLYCCAYRGAFFQYAIEALSRGFELDPFESLEVAISRTAFLVSVGETQKADLVASLNQCYCRQTILYLIAHNWEASLNAFSHVPGTCVISIIGFIDFTLKWPGNIPFVVALTFAAMIGQHQDIKYTPSFDRLITFMLKWSCGEKDIKPPLHYEELIDFVNDYTAEKSLNANSDELWNYAPAVGCNSQLGNARIELPNALESKSNSLLRMSVCSCAHHLLEQPKQIIPALRSIVFAPEILNTLTLEMTFQLAEMDASQTALDELFTTSPFNAANCFGIPFSQKRSADYGFFFRAPTQQQENISQQQQQQQQQLVLLQLQPQVHMQTETIPLEQFLLKPCLRMAFASAEVQGALPSSTERALALAGMISEEVYKKTLSVCILKQPPSLKNADIAQWMAENINITQLHFTMADAVTIGIHVPHASNKHVEWLIANMKSCPTKEVLVKLARLLAINTDLTQTHQLLDAVTLPDEVKLEFLIHILNTCNKVLSEQWILDAVSSPQVLVQVFLRAERLEEKELATKDFSQQPISRVCNAICSNPTGMFEKFIPDVIALLLPNKLVMSASKLVLETTKIQQLSPDTKLRSVLAFAQHPELVQPDLFYTTLRHVVHTSNDKAFLRLVREKLLESSNLRWVVSVDARLLRLGEDINVPALLETAKELNDSFIKDGASFLVRFTRVPKDLEFLIGKLKEAHDSLPSFLLGKIRLDAMSNSPESDTTEIANGIKILSRSKSLSSLLDDLAPMTLPECKLLRRVSNILLDSKEIQSIQCAAEILRRVSDYNDTKEKVDHRSLWGEALNRALYLINGKYAVYNAAIRSIKRHSFEGFRRAIESAAFLASFKEDDEANRILRQVIATTPLGSQFRSTAVKDIVKNASNLDSRAFITAVDDIMTLVQDSVADLHVLASTLLDYGLKEKALESLKLMVFVRKEFPYTRLPAISLPVLQETDMEWGVPLVVRAAGLRGLEEMARFGLEIPVFSEHPNLLLKFTKECWETKLPGVDNLVLFLGCTCLKSIQRFCQNKIAEMSSDPPSLALANQALWLIRVACYTNNFELRERTMLWAIEQVKQTPKATDLLFLLSRGVCEFSKPLAFRLGIKILSFIPCQNSPELLSFFCWLFDLNQEIKRLQSRLLCGYIFSFIKRTANINLLMEFVNWIEQKLTAANSKDLTNFLTEAIKAANEMGICENQPKFVSFASHSAHLIFPVSGISQTDPNWGEHEQSISCAKWLLKMANKIADVSTSKMAAKTIFFIEPTLASYIQLSSQYETNQRAELRAQILSQNISRSLVFEIYNNDGLYSEALTLVKEEVSKLSTRENIPDTPEEEYELAKIIAAASGAIIKMDSIEFESAEKEFFPLLFRMIWRPWQPISAYHSYTISQQVDSYIVEALDLLSQKWPDKISNLQAIHASLSSARNFIMISNKSSYEKLLQRVSSVHEIHQQFGRIEQFWQEFGVLVGLQSNRPRCIRMLRSWQHNIAPELDPPLEEATTATTITTTTAPATAPAITNNDNDENDDDFREDDEVEEEENEEEVNNNNNNNNSLMTGVYRKRRRRS